MNNRWCIIGTPRSGSQYVAQIIAGTIKQYVNCHVYDMLEPFTENQPYKPILTNDKAIQHSEQVDGNLLLTDRINNVISVLMEGDPEQPLVVKLFPYDYLLPHLDKILKVLHDCGFEFMILKRNDIKKQLLSHAVAHKTHNWNSFYGNGILNSSVMIDGEGFRTIYWAYMNLKGFDGILRIFNLTNLPVIHYETAIEDLSKILQMPISILDVTVQKQLPVDTYQFIINAEEVKNFITKLTQ